MKVRYWVILVILNTGLFSCYVNNPQDDIRDNFYTYSEIEDKLKEIATSSSVSALEVLGAGTVQGRNIYGLKISDNPTLNEDEPAIRILADTHGNEKLSGEVALKLIEYLVGNYETDETVRSIIDSSEVWVIPVVNPDGLDLGTRGNSNSVDLNRNFGTNWEFTGLSGAYPFSEPETKAIRELSLREEFKIGISFHTGPGSNGVETPLVSYPPDYDPTYSFPELPQVKKMAEDYQGLNGNPGFGITNGAAWYPITGSCSDWSYEALGMLELTVELSSQQHNGTYYENIGSEIDKIWVDNRSSILVFLQTNI